MARVSGGARNMRPLRWGGGGHKLKIIKTQLNTTPAKLIIQNLASFFVASPKFRALMLKLSFCDVSRLYLGSV